MGGERAHATTQPPQFAITPLLPFKKQILYDNQIEITEGRGGMEFLTQQLTPQITQQRRQRLQINRTHNSNKTHLEFSFRLRT